MKKFLSVIPALSAALAIALSGCEPAERASANVSDGRISVISSIYPSYDFTREIAGENANVRMLLPPDAESHFFEPTPQDIIDIQNSDIFIYTGGEADVWVEKILDSIDTSKTRIITLIDCVDAVEEEIIEGMEEEEEEEEEEGVVYDEHVWTSPQNAELIVLKITDALCGADSENAEVYKQNAEAYIQKLDEIDRKFREVVDNSVRKTLVFGDRFPFRYFTDAYGLSYYAAFPGCSSETEASAGTIKFLIDKTKEEQIPAVFHIELSNEKMANTIAEATGAKTLRLHACHNVSKEDFESQKSYIDLMTENVETLKEALW